MEVEVTETEMDINEFLSGAAGAMEELLRKEDEREMS